MVRKSCRLAAVAAIVPLFLAVPALAEAQGIGIGVKGGFLNSSFDFEGPSEVVESSTGWMAGIFFGGNRPGTIGVMGEANILNKKGERGMSSATVYYLQLPILLRINIGSDNTTRGAIGYGIVGPAVDFKIGDDLGNVFNTDEFESVDISLVIGAGVEISRLIIEGRGTWGLRSIYADPLVGEVKSRTFAILVGLRFN